MKKLRFFEIAALYIGIIMGAGFASGRECWQFFGVFGSDGYLGAIVVTIGFVAFGLMLTYIARSKNTFKLGALISPIQDSRIENVLGTVLAIFYYFDLVVMSAAGGSLLNQQFNISKIYGGLIISALVVFTVLGNFERISKVFRLLVPLLFGVALLMIILVLLQHYDNSAVVDAKPGRITPVWPISAIVFLVYNTLAMITMAGNSAVNAYDRKNAYLGAIIGGACLGLLIILQMTSLLTDAVYTSSLDLPMLGFSMRISPIINVLYALILFGSVYSTGASCYYGFTTIIPENKYKKIQITIGAILAFTLGLTGFTTLVEFLYPVQGYIGLSYLVLICINFAKEYTNNKKNI